jgi:signal recognition particle subunit SEC65
VCQLLRTRGPHAAPILLEIAIFLTSVMVYMALVLMWLKIQTPNVAVRPIFATVLPNVMEVIPLVLIIPMQMKVGTAHLATFATILLLV